MVPVVLEYLPIRVVVASQPSVKSKFVGVVMRSPCQEEKRSRLSQSKVVDGVCSFHKPSAVESSL